MIQRASHKNIVWMKHSYLLDLIRAGQDCLTKKTKYGVTTTQSGGSMSESVRDVQVGCALESDFLMQVQQVIMQRALAVSIADKKETRSDQMKVLKVFDSHHRVMLKPSPRYH